MGQFSLFLVLILFISYFIFGEDCLGAENGAIDRIFFGVDNNIDQSCECGISNTPKIVGGTATLVNEFPWMAYLRVTSPQGLTALCGGVLLSDRHVLTAGHCAVPGILGRIRVVLGDHDRFTGSEVPSIQREVDRIVVHPLYNLFVRFNYDFAILTLDTAVTFTDNVRPICLPKGPSDYTGKAALVLGWGQQQQDGPGSAVLLRANVTVVGQQVCREAYRDRPDASITNAMMCAGSEGAVADACEGDSGGPLMFKEDLGAYIAIGVISFGTECGRPGSFSVHARVDRVLPWIRHYTSLGIYCSRPY